MRDYELYREDYATKDLFVNEIIKRSKLLIPGDRGLVYDYGKNEDLKLYISMDNDHDLRIWVDKWEHPEDPDDGTCVEVEESDDYFYSESEKEMKLFKEELERIWYEDYTV